MEYADALQKAWSNLSELAQEKKYSLRFLTSDYSVDLKNKQVLSLSEKAPAKPFYSILILHYLAQEIKGLPKTKGEWISFKQLAGGQAYYPTFKKRVLDTIARRCKDRPEALLELTERFGAKREQLADISVVIQAFENVPILLTFWRGDEEFGPEANCLFDKSISDIFCTEDITVLAEIVAHSIK